MSVKLVEDEEWPAENDAIGQVALHLAVHDVTEPPKALTDEELHALEDIYDYMWRHIPHKKETLYKLKTFLTKEQCARDKGYSSLPLHYGKAFWRDYIEEAKIAIKTAERIYGKIAMTKNVKRNRNKHSEGRDAEKN